MSRISTLGNRSENRPGQDMGQTGVHAKGAGPEAQDAPFLLLHVGEDGLEVGFLVDDGLGGGKHIFPRWGQGQGGLAIEQRRPIVAFEPRERVAPGLLGDIEPFRRPGHVQLLGQFREIVQADQFHIRLRTK